FITRYLSGLFLLLALAFTYQIGRMLFNRVTGVWAALMLGLLPLVQHYAYEGNSYGLLVMGAAGTTAVLLLWLRSGRGAFAVLYVALGLMFAYTHYYGTVTILAQAVAVAIFVRWRDLYPLRALALFAAVGAGFVAGWGLVVLHSLMGGGGSNLQFVQGSIFDVLAYLYVQFQSRPTGILAMAFLFGVLTLNTLQYTSGDMTRFRFQRVWRGGFPLTMIVGIFVIAVALHSVSPSLNDRNMIVILPFICVVAASGLANMPRRLQAVIAVLVIVAGYTTHWLPDHRRFFAEIPDYMAGQYQPGDGIFLDIPARAEQIVATYYARERQASGERIPPEDVYHVLRDVEFERMVNVFPQPLVHAAQDNSPESLDAVRAYLEGRQQLWHFQLNFQSHSDEVNATIAEQFGVAQTDVPGEKFIATRWQRLPDTPPNFVYGPDITLLDWQMVTPYELAACDTLHVQSWWRGADALPVNYSLGVKMVSQSDGQVLRASDDQLSLVLAQQWIPGRAYSDDSYIEVPCDAPPGTYDILFIVYDPVTPDDALPVAYPDDPETVIGTWAYLTSVQVVE
ncbi:MAG: glycosyltransferase family 39 protein, partial [Chloroflexota bacterium]